MKNERPAAEDNQVVLMPAKSVTALTVANVFPRVRRSDVQEADRLAASAREGQSGPRWLGPDFSGLIPAGFYASQAVDLLAQHHGVPGEEDDRAPVPAARKVKALADALRRYDALHPLVVITLPHDLLECSEVREWIDGVEEGSEPPGIRITGDMPDDELEVVATVALEVLRRDFEGYGYRDDGASPQPHLWCAPGCVQEVIDLLRAR